MICYQFYLGYIFVFLVQILREAEAKKTLLTWKPFFQDSFQILQSHIQNVLKTGVWSKKLFFALAF